jgi:hypothetical protein
LKEAKNPKVNELAKAAAHNTPLPADVFFKVVPDALIRIVEPMPRLINLIGGEDWHAPIMAYLLHYYESDNTTEHIRMQQRAKAYQIVGNGLYKTSVSGPLLQCISKA